MMPNTTSIPQPWLAGKTQVWSRYPNPVSVIRC